MTSDLERPEMDAWLKERGVDDETRATLVQMAAGMREIIEQQQEALSALTREREHWQAQSREADKRVVALARERDEATETATQCVMAEQKRTAHYIGLWHEAREALRPFAECSSDYDPEHCPDSRVVPMFTFTYGDLRRASNFLSSARSAEDSST